MSTERDAALDPFPIVIREFVGPRAETDDVTSALSVESRAALRQFSLERTLAYGVDYADAVELRGRVLDGQDWRSAATELADTCLRRVQSAPAVAGVPTRIAYLRRASALLRMSQMMMLSDIPERRVIFAEAASLYEQAADLLVDRTRVSINTDHGTLAGWLIPAGDAAVASVIIIGGIEGYAMDFDSMGEAFAARGVDALLLDGPGQGETRFIHQHYLSTQWRDAYRRAIDFLEERAPGRPIGFVGNSMGGSLAMAVAVDDTRIRACCNNGGIVAPWMVPPSVGTFFSKMVAYCGVVDPEQAVDVWRTVTPAADGPNAGYPLLVVHGRKDPMISTEMAQMLLESAPTDDKQMVVFSDGDHCIYNHRHDRDVLITDWMRARLCGVTTLELTS
ncbi:alpha/beta fold hydrolase [Frankia sp. CNm7]|uniref:Alpha/beta fold hydrolase n=1 Tax=Frankia nepalensis TaxID=1836974 RepID=A0A937RU85_9ACTN|nr:alpha/beta fold hydrolase [Frankia nepalensis]MBL7501976.1 alpha/beta fold hydrolase [Frankia nepalensis]MBL7510606.1 alpha/beta fold hydrolase [Frankia nepalensis]MBL7517346.1 alpha/beta fold hydrolase [Frankia nepalensis]MBL7633429.1 alpha/beta fold hydrolase [Frankia nepalensis]